MQPIERSSWSPRATLPTKAYNKERKWPSTLLYSDFFFLYHLAFHPTLHSSVLLLLWCRFLFGLFLSSFSLLFLPVLVFLKPAFFVFSIFESISSLRLKSLEKLIVLAELALKPLKPEGQCPLNWFFDILRVDFLPPRFVDHYQSNLYMLQSAFAEIGKKKKKGFEDVTLFNVNLVLFALQGSLDKSGLFYSLLLGALKHSQRRPTFSLSVMTIPAKNQAPEKLNHYYHNQLIQIQSIIPQPTQEPCYHQ
ncbi:uncharacterized protein LOC125475830 [Pyrus x bretschneideri]|uniref:uncharacterized protein LOC125475830 n=1 Tax=Pyrus x bretschneideri TaxID=225117 RepID=UPI0020303159|nr:uncharacterized protein LOC125475830 [Pyrus x bretschneideri]